jgi:hypothetical protein
MRPDAPKNKALGVEPRASEEQLHDNTNRTDSGVCSQEEGQYSSRRRFLIWACMAGYVGPERVTERILAELASAVQP